jgi:hypothetical protein
MHSTSQCPNSVAVAPHLFRFPEACDGKGRVLFASRIDGKGLEDATARLEMSESQCGVAGLNGRLSSLQRKVDPGSLEWRLKTKIGGRRFRACSNIFVSGGPCPRGRRSRADSL